MTILHNLGKYKYGYFMSQIIEQRFTFSSFIKKENFKLVVVGGGAGGCSISAKFTSKLGKNMVAVVEPSEAHYYQPMWTLVGGGMKRLDQSAMPMQKVLPKNAKWFRNRAVHFCPESNSIALDDGTELGYEFLVVAVGLETNYSTIKGLPEALETPGVCSNFSPFYVEKTFESLKNFESGPLIFTHPNSPIKCPGASQKIMYIAEDHLRKNNRKANATISFYSSLPVIFGVKKYADSLWEIVKERNIEVNLKHNLEEVIPDRKEAVFRKMDSENETVTVPYEVLHITPPMSAPEVLKKSKMVDGTGFLDVNKDTLQHNVYPNIFGIGDCTNLPTSKTAAAVAGQTSVLSANLSSAMKGDRLPRTYDGYTSCPLVTGYSKCVLAEFDYNLEPLETFPVNQAKERRLMFHLKKDVMPTLYWKALLKGYWGGPKIIRKLTHLGLTN